MAYSNYRSGYDREHRGVIRRVRFVIGLLILLLAALRFVVGFALVRDDGMGDAVKSGRPVVFLRVGREAKRGELVCLRLPDGRTAVRRVVAVPGDSVDLRDGIAYINGLAERGSYSFTRTDARQDGPQYPLLLREGEVFLLGDARETAVDSRSFGVVRTEELLGRVLG